MKDAILSVLRHLLTIGGTYAASKGILDAGQVETAIGAVITLGAVIWGIVDKTGRPATPPAAPPTSPTA